jgi:hypothetical protein
MQEKLEKTIPLQVVKLNKKLSCNDLRLSIPNIFYHLLNTSQPIKS